MTDSHGLRILFPNAGLAEHYAQQCAGFGDLDITLTGATVIIEGDSVAHPEFRADMLHAASIIGGNEVPYNRKLN